MKGLGSGIYEIALAYCGDAYISVYAVQLGEEIWVVHAFQKRSKRGMKAPKQEIYVIQARTSPIIQTDLIDAIGPSRRVAS